MINGKINVLVAQDSASMRLRLVQLLESDPQICVIGAVSNGQDAVDFVQRNKPDVVLMDIQAPYLKGFEATRRIMETKPLPIIVCCAASESQDLVFAFEAMEAGAIACVKKPCDHQSSDFEATSAHLLQTVKLMSEVKVVRRSNRLHRTPLPQTYPAESPLHPEAQISYIGIGASTGGPPVLQTILSALPKDFAVPLLVVQHIAQGFLSGMVDWLNNTTGLQTHIATGGTRPLPGHVYLAPDDFHMGISRNGSITLTRQGPENQLRPAVSFLFRSLAEVCGPNALGVLLTGMGEDGAEELKAMKDKGAITIAQDRESSVVHGMPGAAIALGGASHVLPADKIAAALVMLVNGRNGLARKSDSGGRA